MLGQCSAELPLGTLTPISRLPSLCRPTPHLSQTLTTLASDARNTIFVISGARSSQS